MVVAYSPATQVFTVMLDATEQAAWRRYRARLRKPGQPALSQKETMQALLNPAWVAAQTWADGQTRTARQKAYDRATPAQQAAAEVASEAAKDAAIGFDPEA